MSDKPIDGENEVFSIAVQDHQHFIRIGSYEDGTKSWIAVDHSDAPSDLTLGDIMSLIIALSKRAEMMIPEDMQ